MFCHKCGQPAILDAYPCGNGELKWPGGPISCLPVCQAHFDEEETENFNAITLQSLHQAKSILNMPAFTVIKGGLDPT